MNKKNKELEQPTLIRLNERVDEERYALHETEYGTYKVPYKTAYYMVLKKNKSYLIEIGALKAYIQELEEKIPVLEKKVQDQKDLSREFRKEVKSEEMYKLLKKRLATEQQHSRELKNTISELLIRLNKEEKN